MNNPNTSRTKGRWWCTTIDHHRIWSLNPSRMISLDSQLSSQQLMIEITAGLNRLYIAQARVTKVSWARFGSLYVGRMNAANGISQSWSQAWPSSKGMGMGCGSYSSLTSIQLFDSTHPVITYMMCGYRWATQNTGNPTSESKTRKRSWW